MSISGILLDLDDTLYEYNSAHDYAIEHTIAEISEQFQLPKSSVQEAFSIAKTKIKTMLPIAAAGHDRQLYFQHMFEILKINPLLFSYEAAELYWEKFFMKMILTKDAVEFLKDTRELPICLVTDLTCDIQFRKVKKLGLQDRISSIVTSEEVGVEKPHPFPFLYAMKKLHCKSDEVIMIGDNYKKDVVGATSLGIQTYLIDRNQLHNKKIHTGYEVITSLTDISI